MVANGNKIILYGDGDLLPVPHNKLINGIVHYFLEQDIDAVIIGRTVTEPSDIHAGTEADMFEGAEGLYFALIVYLKVCFSVHFISRLGQYCLDPEPLILIILKNILCVNHKVSTIYRD